MKGVADSRYVFDEVLNQEATQSMVFERTAKPLLAGVLDGYNATVFAYGVSWVYGQLELENRADV